MSNGGPRTERARYSRSVPLTPVPRQFGPTARTAVVGSAALVALTVAAKSTRDALFCARFPAGELPKVMVAGAALSALLAVLSARLFRSWAPAHTLPALLVANAFGFIAEHAGFAFAPRTVALILYLHVSAVTGIIISGFWSAVNERFDPHTLRISISRIGLGGTVGGIVGGVAAERVAAWAGARQTLLALAALSGLGALTVWMLGAPTGKKIAAPRAPTTGVLRSTYLRELASFVALTALASSVIDFAFKMRAMERYSSAEALVHFFALFYAATSLVGFFVQAFVTPLLLERAGLGVGLAGLPLVVAGTGLIALAVPNLAAQTILRGADGALSNTLFRSAYEPLFTPLSPERKRSVKALIDVLINRFGDGLGSLLSWGLVLVLPGAATTAATGAAVMVAIATLFVAGRLRRGYVAELAASLRSGAVVLDEANVSDQTTRLTLSRTMSGLSADRLRSEIQKLREEEILAKARSQAALTASEPDAPTDAERTQHVSLVLSDLASRDVERIDRALDRADPSLATFVIPHLASQSVGAHAMKVLGAFGTRVTGQLADALLDRSRSSPTVRRRLVRVIAEGKSPWAAAALTTALDDPDFEVRRQVVRSLEEIADHGVPVPLVRDRTLAFAINELTNETLSPGERVEHALRLLGLSFERDAFRLAHAALVSGDEKLRGTGLEYLENVLPESVRGALLAALATVSSPKPRRLERELLDELRRTLA
jgi:ATP:ADP antiporter, AAA family